MRRVGFRRLDPGASHQHTELGTVFTRPQRGMISSERQLVTRNLTNEDDSDSENSDAEDQSEQTPYELKCGNINLGIAKNYVPSWTPKDAFRECYQNWRDGIVESFKIDSRALRLVTEENKSAITIKAFKNHDGAVSPELVGFISYDKVTGRTQLCNFNARLEAKHLCMGESSKRSSDHLAGTHGEGLKIAALVMRRRGYGVRIASSSFYWNFHIARGDQATLRCKLTQPSPGSLSRKKAYAKQMACRNDPRPLVGRVWEDVTFFLTTGKGEHGRMIEEFEFRDWLTVALDLDPPRDGEMIKTPTGDLLLGPTHSGRVYLKGLRVSGHGTDGRVYSHGYNFLTGRINRDRERLVNQSEEAAMVATIWTQAMSLGSGGITDTYLKLFHDNESGPDTAFAAENINISTARLMWERLLETSSRVFFFHGDDHSSDYQFEAITKLLRMEPRKLPKTLWKIFRSLDLVRTPTEQLFKKSAIVNETKNNFAITISWILHAFLQLDPRLRLIKLCFVEGGRTQIDLLYEAKCQTLRIHEKCTKFEEVHEDSSCDVEAFSKYFPTKEDDFLCDHVAEDLVERVLDKVRGSLGMTLTESRALRRKARSYIRSMPRQVTVKVTANANELVVQWIGNEGSFVFQKCGSDILYLVTLHMASTCDMRKAHLLDENADEPFPAKATDSPNYGTSTSPCQCPRQVVSRIDSKAIFSGLNHHEAYFPLVRRLVSPSFYGIPPKPLSPRATALLKISLVPPAITSIQACADKSRREKQVATSQEAKRVEHSDWIEDMKTWRKWYAEEMSLAVAESLPEYEAKPPCPHLDYTFRRDQLVCIELTTSQSGFYFVYVRDILYQLDGNDESSYSLLVTKFSAVSTSKILSKLSSDNLELLLHFRNYRNMGSEANAELIEVDNIKSAQETSHKRILYCTERPRDMVEGDAFCRFGIRTFVTPGIFCITRLAPSLLPRSEKLSEVSYQGSIPPIVYDLSPNALGPAEGFRQAGYIIDSAFDFNEEHNVTWRARYPLSSVFSGSFMSTMSKIESGTLNQLTSSTPGAAKIAVIAGEYSFFSLSEEDISLPSLERFCKPFENLSAIATSPLRPDYVVALLSPAVLHPLAIEKFSRSMSQLLEHQFSIQLKVCRSSGSEVRPVGMVLALIVSRTYADLPWDSVETSSTAGQATELEAMIKDLAITSARPDDPGSSEFLTSVRAMSNGQLVPTGTAPVVHVYNHYVGNNPPAGDFLNKVFMRPFAFGQEAAVRHPRLERILTIREIARLQGFDDDYIFYGSRATQYLDVLNSIPPAISKKIADSILRFIRGGPNTSEPTSLSNDRGEQTADNIRYGQNISESGVGGKTTTSTGSAEQAGGYGGKSDDAEPQKQTRREQGYGPGSGVGA
ncbi:hypothetical protein LTR84_008780 [Exophiala bonariae]|uniref:DNA (cytosine-5-)-methyltransferase n=1 Tax=Exophiala bonariae TaxID=1690606 RepID=A0AAV9MYJ6_9EURO|nr:hypothetical protein LTR84_008780 [Exophiala bonariae]